MTNQASILYRESKAFLEAGNDVEAIDTLKKVIALADVSEETLKFKEKAIKKLGKIYAKKNSGYVEIADLIRSLKDYFGSISKAKTTKIVRGLIDVIFDMQGSEQALVELCQEFIEWAKVERQVILKQRLEFKLAAVYFKTSNFQDALTLLTNLLSEVKKLDDKPLLVECHLLESRIHHGLFNLSRSRAALTSARTDANVIYCPPLLQAELDMMSGTLHCDEKDYKTAYSYFYESYENYESIENPKSFKSLQYMLLCKIMSNNVEEVNSLINGKLALKYALPALDAMRAIAKAFTNRSLKEFQEYIHKFKDVLAVDKLISRHLNELYESLLEQNLLRIIEPYSQVEITHISKVIELPVRTCEKKLSQMILDKKLAGVLDQGSDSLIIFDEPEIGGTYSASLETIEQMSNVVATLYNKSSTLS